jgi:hypothetical protein
VLAAAAVAAAAIAALSDHCAPWAAVM